MAEDGGLQLLTSEEPPTNFTAADGKVTGITTDIVEEIKRRLKVTTPVVLQPWARSYDTFSTTPNVAIFTLGKTPERVALGFNFIGPVITRKQNVYKKAGSPLKVASMDDIKRQNLNVGAVRGDWRSGYFTNQGIKVEDVPTHDANIKKLMVDRLSLFVLSDIELGMNAKRADVSMDKIELAFTVMETSSYLGLSKGTSSEIIEKWQKAFEEVQKDTKFTDKLAKKWSSVLGSPVSFAVDKGFFLK